jgi:hypothetical protein
MYEEESVPMLALVPDFLHAGTFGVTFGLFFSIFLVVKVTEQGYFRIQIQNITRLCAFVFFSICYFWFKISLGYGQVCDEFDKPSLYYIMGLISTIASP